MSPNGREPGSESQYQPSYGSSYQSYYQPSPVQPAAEPDPQSEEVAQTMPVEYAQEPSSPGGGTAPYVPAEVLSSLPVRSRSRGQDSSQEVPTTGAAPPSNAALLVPRGAVEMLPNESVVFQLGALYLTNKRVILLAPSVLRTAFLRDVDAIGTMSERASGWSFFFGLVMLGLAGSAIYFSLARSQYESNLPTLYILDPRIVAAVLGVMAIYLLINYFFWVKRTLFLSVGGRPLITVSITDWNARKLEGMDSFINMFSQVKDAIHSGEQVE